MGAAVVPGGEASPVLEPAEHAFDAARLRPPFIRGCTGFDLFEAQRIIAADRNARVVYMNRAAEQLLDKAICLRLEKNRLVPTDRTACATLMKAIDLVTENAVSPPLGDTIIPCPDPEGASLIATALPLHSIRPEGTSRSVTATAAVVLQDSTAPPISTGEAFAQLHGLTKSELRVLLAMSPDLSLKQVAERWGISETTAKTHLQHIFAKTTTSRQSELIHLLMSLTPPLDRGTQHRGSESQ